MRKTGTFKTAFIMVIIIAVLSLGASVVLGAVYTKTLDVAPFIESDRTYDTTRAVAEAFGIHVDWDGATQTVTLSRSPRQVVLKVGSNEMIVTDAVGIRSILLDAAPVLKDNRVFLPVRLWAEHFDLEVKWSEETGGVTVSRGAKTLSIKPGSKEISLSGGYFLKSYTGRGVRFFYPETGILGSVWDGYAEAIIPIAGKEFVISAVNSGAGVGDFINHTEEEMTEMVMRNAELNGTEVKLLPDYYYGAPALRVSGLVSGAPQAGVVFINNGYICGIGVEYKWTPKQIEETADVSSITEVTELDESELSRLAQVQKPDITEAEALAYLDIVNALLDEVLESFSVY